MSGNDHDVRADPSNMPGSGVDLARLRERVSELLDSAVTGGSLVTLPVRELPSTVETEESPAVPEQFGVQSSEENQLVEVTAEQLEALNEAHDALAEALASLDTGRK